MAAKNCVESPVIETLSLGVVSVFLLGYLLFALLVPEKF